MNDNPRERDRKFGRGRIEKYPPFQIILRLNRNIFSLD
jgi:hypothetical protein